MIVSEPEWRNHNHKWQAGFTIIELLVSLVILALILSFLPGTLRIGKRVWEVQDNLEQIAAHSAFHHYVEQRLVEAMPVFNRDRSGRIQIYFDGGPNSVRFVAPALAGPDGGGVYLFALAQNTVLRTGNVVLILRQKIYRHKHSETATTRAVVHTAPGRIAKLTLRYFGKADPNQAPRWQTRWSRHDALPDLVEINVTMVGPKPVSEKRVVELKLRARR